MRLFKTDPFSLMAFHRVLIGTAVAACLFYGGWEFYRNFSREPLGASLRGAFAWLLAVGFVIYLRRIRGKR